VSLPAYSVVGEGDAEVGDEVLGRGDARIADVALVRRTGGKAEVAAREPLAHEARPSVAETGVVAERHYALNWLVRDGDAEWDDVKTAT
jgi:hypothetical protein